MKKEIKTLKKTYKIRPEVINKWCLLKFYNFQILVLTFFCESLYYVEWEWFLFVSKSQLKLDIWDCTEFWQSYDKIGEYQCTMLVRWTTSLL